MNEEKINKLLFYLYNYKNIDELIEQRRNEIRDTENVLLLLGYNQSKANL